MGVVAMEEKERIEGLVTIHRHVYLPIETFIQQHCNEHPSKQQPIAGITTTIITSSIHTINRIILNIPKWSLQPPQQILIMMLIKIKEDYLRQVSIYPHHPIFPPSMIKSNSTLQRTHIIKLLHITKITSKKVCRKEA